MKFTLVEADIKQAIQDYIGKIITINPNATVDIDIKATRGADGVTAEIDVALAGSVKAEPAAGPVTRSVEPAPAVATKPAPAAVIAEPVPEQLATASAPTVEPELDNADDAAFDADTAEAVAEPVAGKSIFG